jgi:hypothetical protein
MEENAPEPTVGFEFVKVFDPEEFRDPIKEKDLAQQF